MTLEYRLCKPYAPNIDVFHHMNICHRKCSSGFCISDLCIFCPIRNIDAYRHMCIYPHRCIRDCDSGDYDTWYRLQKLCVRNIDVFHHMNICRRKCSSGFYIWDSYILSFLFPPLFKINNNILIPCIGICQVHFNFFYRRNFIRQIKCYFIYLNYERKNQHFCRIRYFKNDGNHRGNFKSYIA